MRKKLTESQLHNLIKNKVRKALRENEDAYNQDLNEYDSANMNNDTLERLYNAVQKLEENIETQTRMMKEMTSAVSEILGQTRIMNNSNRNW